MTTRKYAEDTTVPVERTIGEIQALVRKSGGTHWSYGESDDHDPPLSVVQFRLRGYHLRFTVQHPSAHEVARTPGGQVRTSKQRADAAHHELMRRWRSLGLLIKAQLTVVTEGVVSVEQAMLAHIVIGATGETVGEWMAPQQAALLAGRSLPQLPAATAVRITEEH